MTSLKVVTPVKTGVQHFCNTLKFLDSGVHRNDGFGAFAISGHFRLLTKASRRNRVVKFAHLVGSFVRFSLHDLSGFHDRQAVFFLISGAGRLIIK
jgi:hypothetical protein